VIDCHCPDCTDRELRLMEANERRVKAALAATKHFTVEGLEQIAADDKSLELALLASANLIVLDKAQREAKAGFEAGRKGFELLTGKGGEK
jgi:hypothetical protein